MSDQKIDTSANKVPLDLVPMRALVGTARVFGYGAQKYAPGNFYTADDDSIVQRYVGGVLRHLSRLQRDDGLYDMASVAALDVESGLPEIDHAICGLIMLRALAIKHGALPVDPMPPGVDSSRLDPLFEPLETQVQCRSSSEPVFDAEPEVHDDRCRREHPERGRCVLAAGHDTPGSTLALTRGLSHKSPEGIRWR